MKRIGWALAITCTVGIGTSGSAVASTPYPMTIKCPVGGQSFTHTATASYSSWGARPDGKPYGSWIFPNPLPVCPGNGLVVFMEFSAAQVEKLKELIARDDYRAMIDRDTSYYRAAFLSRAIEREPIDSAWLLLQASWQADGQAELKARYQREYVAAVQALPRQEGEQGWTISQLRAVNALRELGQFEEARTMLDGISLAPFDVAVPAEAFEPTKGGGRRVTNWDEVDAAKRKRSLLAFAEDLRGLIADKNAASEPLRLIPASAAAMICKEQQGRLTGPDVAFCESEPIKRLMRD